VRWGPCVPIPWRCHHEVRGRGRVMVSYFSSINVDQLW
jgi:hypothetical protein